MTPERLKELDLATNEFVIGKELAVEEASLAHKNRARYVSEKAAKTLRAKALQFPTEKRPHALAIVPRACACESNDQTKS